MSRQKHKENKDTEIPGMDMKADAIQTATNILDCMSIPQLQQATAQDDHLQLLKGFIIIGLPENRDQML